MRERLLLLLLLPRLAGERKIEIVPDAQPTDADLIRRANRGDARAFELLYERYREWLVAVAFLWYLVGTLLGVPKLGSAIWARCACQRAGAARG